MKLQFVFYYQRDEMSKRMDEKVEENVEEVSRQLDSSKKGLKIFEEFKYQPTAFKSNQVRRLG